MTKNYLEFSPSGTEFKIFIDGEKGSKSYASKEAGFKALTELIKNTGKITPDEFNQMRDQILVAEKLPWSEKVTVQVSIMGSPFGISPFGGFFGGPAGLFEAISILDQIEDLDSSEVFSEVAQFVMCPCGGNHGFINGKVFCSDALESKEDALSFLENLKKDSKVSDEDYLRVKSEIETSKLK